MRLSTHILFGAGASSLVASLAGVDRFHIMVLWGIAVLHHTVIDRLSHESGGRYRTRLFHSLLGATLLSLAIGGLYIAVDPTLAHPPQALGFIAGVLVSGWSHLLLDSMNPGGVFVGGRRRRIARISYRDPLANMLLQALGAFMAIYSIT